MVRTYTILLILDSLLLSTFIVGSVQVQNRYSLGDQFTYSENTTKTTVNLFTREKEIEKEETIYKERIVELEDPLTNSNAEIEKTYMFAHFTPSNERATRRLLSQRTRQNFEKAVESSSTEYSVGQKWKQKTVANCDRYTTVTHIYQSDEYNTEVIRFDIEIIGIHEVWGHEIPLHHFVTKEVDVASGILLFEEKIEQITVGDERRTEITVKKLIKHETHSHEL